MINYPIKFTLIVFSYLLLSLHLHSQKPTLDRMTIQIDYSYYGNNYFQKVLISQTGTASKGIVIMPDNMSKRLKKSYLKRGFEVKFYPLISQYDNAEILNILKEYEDDGWLIEILQFLNPEKVRSEIRGSDEQTSSTITRSSFFALSKISN